MSFTKTSSSFLTIASLLHLLLVSFPTPTFGGCGCAKPPPLPAVLQPKATYPGMPVVVSDTRFRSGQSYRIVFLSRSNLNSATVYVLAATRRSIATGRYEPQLVIPVPPLPLGPASVRVSQAGQSAPLLSIPDTEFTVVPRPIVVPRQVGTYHYQNFRAAIGHDGVVRLSLDLSQVRLPIVVEAQAQGYPLRFAAEQVSFYNTQGILMQLLGRGMPGLFSVQPATTSTTSTLLRYSRHEFNTFYLQHGEKQAHLLNPQDANWHQNGTLHIDHDHLIVALRAVLPDNTIPSPGASSPFTLVVRTYSLFHHGLVGTASVDLSGKASIDSYNKRLGSFGANGDVLSNGVVKVSDNAMVKGGATGFSFDLSGQGVISGAHVSASQPTQFMSVPMPQSLPNLGLIEVKNTDTRTLLPGSYRASGIIVSSDATLFVNNAAGPVTLYVTGSVDIQGKGITVADTNPEKFAVYVVGGADIKLQNTGKFHGVVYAPNSFIDISGKGQFFGAFVGKTVKVSNDAVIHYEPALRGE